MSQTIEERVVQMKFDGKQFEKGVNNTIKKIGQLEDSLQLKNAEDGLNKLQKSIDDVDFNRLADAVDTIASRFTNLGIVGMQVLTKLSDKAIRMATDLVNKVAIQPVTEGMTKYFDMLSSTAVMKNAGESLTAIDENLAKLMKYSDETSYSFTQMTAAASSFVNAGQSLEKSEKIIEGIANAAASAGVSTRNAQPIFNAFSKAMTKGELSLQQWYSLDASGFATQDFRKRLLDAGVATGKLNKDFEILGKTVGKDKKTIKATLDNLTETLQYGWVDRDVMAHLFQSYAMDQAAYEMAQKARSFQDVWDATADAVSSSWLTTWQLIFGDLDQATEFFTNLANGIYDILMPWNELRNSYFAQMAEGGVFDRIRSNFYELMEPMADISTAMSNLFGGAVMRNVTSFIESIPKSISGVTDALSIFADYVTLTDDEVSSSKSWFLNPEKSGVLKGEQDVAGYFQYWEDFMPKMIAIKDGLASIMELIRGVLSNVGSFFKGIFGQLTPTFKSLGSAFADIGAIITTFVNLLLGKDPVYKTAKTNKLQRFTQALLKILKPFTNLINKAAKAIQGFTDKIRKWLSKSKVQAQIEKTFNNIFAFLDKIPGKIEGAFNWVKEKTKPIADWFKNLIGDLSDPEKKTARLKKLQETWDAVKTWAKNTWDRLKEIFVAVTQPIADWFKNLVGDLSDPEKRTELLKSIQDKWQGIKDWFSTTWTKIKEFLAPVTQPIADWFNTLAGDLSDPEKRAKKVEEIQKVWTSIKEWFSTTWTAIKEFLTPAVDAVWTPIADWFNNLAGDLSDPEKRAKKVEEIQSKWEEIVTKIKGFWNDFVWPTVEPISNFFSTLWASVFGGMQSGEDDSPEAIEQKAASLEESFTKAWDAVVKFFTTIWEKITGLFGGGSGEKSESGEKGPADVAEAVEKAKSGLPAIDFAGLGEKLKGLLVGIGGGAVGFKILDIVKGFATKDKTPKKSIFEKVGDMVHDVGAGLLMLAGGFAIMAVGVFALSEMDEEKFDTGLDRAASILLRLVEYMGIMVLGAKVLGVDANKAGAVIKDAGAGIALMAAGVLLAGLAIAGLGILPVNVLEQGGEAFKVILLWLAGAGTILAVASSGAIGTSLSSAATILALAAAIDLIAIAVAGFGYMDDNALEKGLGVVKTLLVDLTLVVSILSLIGIAGALSAAGALLAFVGTIGVAAKIVEFFATGIIESIGTAIVSMASKLEMAKGMLGDGNFDVIKNGLAIFGEFVLSATTMVGVDMSGVYAVGAAMLDMSQNLVLYAGNIKDLDFSNSAAALQAAKDVASIAESINSIQNASELSTVIANVGAAIDLYYQHLAKVGGEGEDASVDPAKIATMFNDLVENMPDDAQIKQIASFSKGGGNDLTSFALGLTNLGTALKDYATSVEDLNENKLKTATDVLDFLGTLNTKLTASIVVVSLLGEYKTPLQSFGGDIVTLGTALRDFSNKTSGMKESKIKTATNALDFMGTLQEKLPQRGGLFAFFAGHKTTLGEFATDMNTLGEGLKNFASKVSDAGFGEGTDNAIAFLGKWVDMQTKLAGMTEGTLRVKDIAFDLQELDTKYFTNIQRIVDKMKGFDASGEGVDNFISFLRRISTIQKNLVGMTRSSLRIEDLGSDLKQYVNKGYMTATQTFTSEARKIDVSGMDNFLSFLTDFATLESIANTTDSYVLDAIGGDMLMFMDRIGKDLTSGFANALMKDTSEVDAAAGSVASSAKNEIASYENGFYATAGYLIAGLANGLRNRAYIAVSAVSDVGEQVVTAMNQVLQVNSPSKVFETIGMYLDQGLAQGLLKYAYAVSDASGEVGENAVSRSKEVMAQVSAALANDLDTTPTITPVLDMSQIEAGSSQLNSLFGARSVRVNTSLANGAAAYTESRAASSGYIGYDDSNVLDAFSIMNERIDQLGKDIANLQLVLDTGILAGALTPKIDRNLGDLAALKGRSAFY